MDNNTISGKVLLDGKGIADQVILVLSAEMNQLLSSTTTAPDGNYSVDLPQLEKGTVAVLAVKIQGPALALNYREIDAGLTGQRHDFDFDTSSDLFSLLQAEIIKDFAEEPPFIAVAITPIHLADIPDPISRYFLRRSKNVVDASYYEEDILDDRFNIKVQRGIYRISGTYIHYKGPTQPGEAPDNFIVKKIVAEDEQSPLPGEPLGGLVADLMNDRKIKMYVDVFR